MKQIPGRTGQASDTVRRNRRNRRQRQGYTGPEVILVLFLLLVFGLAAFAMVYTGGESYRRMTEERNAEGEMRIALSYLQGRIRHHDGEGGIRIEPDNNSLLVLTETVNDREYETRIYWHEGRLRELMTLPGAVTVPEQGFDIAEIDDFHLTVDPSGYRLTIRVGVVVGGILRTMESLMTIKAGR